VPRWGQSLVPLTIFQTANHLVNPVPLHPAHENAKTTQNCEPFRVIVNADPAAHDF